MQKALEAVYASGELRGKKLLEARRLVELRQRHGKQRGGARSKQPRARMTGVAAGAGSESCVRSWSRFAQKRQVADVEQKEHSR